VPHNRPPTTLCGQTKKQLTHDEVEKIRL